MWTSQQKLLSCKACTCNIAVIAWLKFKYIDQYEKNVGLFGKYFWLPFQVFNNFQTLDGIASVIAKFVFQIWKVQFSSFIGIYFVDFSD